MATAAVLRDAVHNSMLWHQNENATFLAERLVAEERTEETLHLLATTHFRANKPSYAYSILKGLTSQACRYLFARCCLALDRLQEGELALTGALFPGATTDMTSFGQTRGAAHALLGDICLKALRSEQAIECYRKSLQDNPLLWTSFEALCRLGAQPDPEHYFRSDVNLQQLAANITVTSAAPTPAAAAAAAVETITPLPSAQAQLFGPSGTETPMSALQTPAQTPAAMFTPITPGTGAFVQPFALAGSPAAVPLVSALGSPAPWSYTTPSPARTPATSSLADKAPAAPTTSTRTPPQVRKSSRLNKTGKDGSPVVRRSMRLFSSHKGKGKDGKKSKLGKDGAGANDAKKRVDFATPAPPNRSGSGPADDDEPGVSTAVYSADGAVALLCQLGKGIAALEEYKCADAIEHFHGLPDNHFRTAWTYCQIGRANFELADYKEADNSYRMARRLEPYRSQGMEIYSTTLWHLRQETALSYLAHEVTSADRLSPEAWCVVGNCFSLQKEHDQAVKFFERAVQLDPSFSYAYTLLGHEYVYIEDFTRALNCFRSAVHKDPRHYNAWYGLGMIYYRQEKYDLAEYHFAKAIQINPASAILLCYLGIVQHAQNKSLMALGNMEKASALDDTIPLVKFNKAVVLTAINRNEEALEELTKLKRIAPKESSVYFLMGKVFKKLGQHDNAMMYLSWAMDLDPKGSNNLIKEAIDKHQLPEDEDQSFLDASLPLPEITSPQGGTDGGRDGSIDVDLGDIERASPVGFEGASPITPGSAGSYV